MTAHTDYQKVKDRYLSLVNEKKAIENKIQNNVNNPEALTGLRSDYRSVINELEEIYKHNIDYFTKDQIHKNGAAQ